MRPRFFHRVRVALSSSVLALTCASTLIAQPAPPADGPAADSSSNATRSEINTNDPIARIRDEGLNHSQVMTLLEYLTDVIGPRLTGSANLKRANEWTRDKLESWCLTNAHLEAWGPFGRGWTLKRFSATLVEPQPIPLIGSPNAWSPGFEHPLVADVVYLDVKTNADLEKYKGKLKGAIVLATAVRELRPRFEPMASRLGESNLLFLANAGEPRPGMGRFGFSDPNDERRGPADNAPRARRDPAGGDERPSGTNVARFGPGRFGRFQPRYLSFLAREGAALVVNASSQGDGGAVFVAAASVPVLSTNTLGPDTGFRTNSMRAWSPKAKGVPPQITLAAEDYNRLARMVQSGEHLKMAVDLEVEFHDEDPMAYNTVAEIPGSDLKDEIVMLGAHMDSWHSGTGATDNGAGVAATMEAMRIIKTLDLRPRRTIRLGLWSGEEQGLLGSRAYVSNHFGYYNTPGRTTSVRGSEESSNPEAQTAGPNSAPARKLIRQEDYEQLSAYFNLDNGAGKIRGVYLQGNEAARALFRRWLAPFADLGAETITLSNTGGTDHTSFDAIGLPGFQFIQDPLDYETRTHHSNQDVYDRVPAQDLKQAAVILAACAYDAAMLDEKMPRKPTSERASVGQ